MWPAQKLGQWLLARAEKSHIPAATLVLTLVEVKPHYLRPTQDVNTRGRHLSLLLLLGCPQKPKDSNTAQAQHRKDSPRPRPRLSIWIELASELALNVDSSISTVNKNFHSTGRTSKVWIVTGKEATENLLR